MRPTLFALSLFAITLFVASPAGAAQKKKGGKIPAEVKAKAQALFDKTDTNHDGKISKEEFSKAVGSLPIKIPSATIDKAFSKLDLNGDGFLTKEEIKQVGAKLKGLHAQLNKENLKKLFEKLKGQIVHQIALKLHNDTK
jgi:hypothetical protein